MIASGTPDRDGATPAVPVPLDGIRIIDLSGVIFGPCAAQMLADLGAEVIKVETTAGDIPRYLGRSRAHSLMGGTHLTVNRGKQSKSADGAAALRALLPSADVFVHNMRHPAIAWLGFDYDAVRAAAPAVIYVHLTGFGPGGPWARLPAYDDIIQAATGATSLLSRVDGDPRPRLLPSLLADKVAGTYAAQAILAALVHRLRTGAGQ